MHRARRRTGLTRFGVIVVLSYVLATVLVLVGVSSARADEWQEEPRFTPSTRGEMRAIAYDRAAARGANPEVVWRVVSECEVRSLDPHARGDGGHSHGLAQLGDQQWTGNLLGHFYSLGYSSPYDPWQAFDYLSRAISGEFIGAAWGNIGPWRWSCWRLLYGNWP